MRCAWVRRTGERGQSLVEFTMVVPVFIMILFGILEFGLAFDHGLTLNYATREGARMGSALSDGSTLVSPATCGDVDKYVISAVERVLTSEGSPVRDHLGDISSIVIYKANSAGNPIGSNTNTWTPGSGPTVDGRALHFAAPASNGWATCSRSNATTAPDSIGVRITYTYNFSTPLGNVLRLVGGSGSGSLQINDKTVMALNPLSQ